MASSSIIRSGQVVGCDTLFIEQEFPLVSTTYDDANNKVYYDNWIFSIEQDLKEESPRLYSSRAMERLPRWVIVA